MARTRSGIGDAPKRREDLRFLTGNGRYLDDLAFGRMAHAVMLRSPQAHARILGLDTAAARAAPGILAVLTAADARADGLKPLSPSADANTQTGERFAFAPQPLLAEEKVRYVGEPVALIVAETRDAALDAAELVAIDYAPLPAVTNTASARATGAPELAPEVPGNLCFEWLTGDSADIASTKTRAHFQSIAEELLDRRHPGRFNQAMMELGATVCLPRTPRCVVCPVARYCEAYKTGRQRELPVKRRKPAALRLGAQVAVVEKNGAVLLRQRPAGASLMPGFWELPAPEDLPGWRAARTAGTFRHTITHHLYTITVFSGKISRVPAGFRWRRWNLLTTIPLTTISRKALRLWPSE